MSALLRYTGWAWPTDARKVHYFVDGKVACSSRWPVRGGEDRPDYNPVLDPELTCQGCWSARIKQLG